ncbi:family 2 encapsulin nanocompartment cargo protein polyprenyl transferase [Crossiella cryophila]|uniref:Geranylgeranyl diphosphate synthase type I n=1 Tax=Crossiella cryophila TaxID=43355 RepID=A0A7W7FUV0_9PSEU|nr:family 2 encapsulin nanocompartment cargo protein polyprenyl transferase [Crossiella cryophila]MBB4678395.1 geranylgeranyl diphosphate synthase type I [Crossiella cryophila]
MTLTTAVTGERSAEDVLAWSRSLIEPALRRAVDTLPPLMRRGAGYHLGWWDQDGGAIRANPGKSIRPALVLLSALTVGGTAEAAVPAAVAVELVHNFSLVHDDVMDRDPVRRHRPTAWTVFGTSDAILFGDAMLALASRVLADGGGATASIAVGWLNDSVLALCDGQSADLAFEQRTSVRLDECLAMVAGKTGALLGGSCALGALAGGADEARVSALRRFGDHIGLAFQLVDDLLGIWGAPEVTGKSAGNDLRNRKKSLPVAAALAADTAQSRELAAYYARPEPIEAHELDHMRHLVEAAGGRRWTQREAGRQVASAVECLESAACEPEAARQLLDLANLITRRRH